MISAGKDDIDGTVSNSGLLQQAGQRRAGPAGGADGLAAYRAIAANLPCLLALGGLVWGPYTPMETTLLQRNVPKAQLGRVFGARSTLLIAGSPLGLAAGGILLAFVPSTSVIALSAIASIVVGLGGLLSPAFRSVSLPAADFES